MPSCSFFSYCPHCAATLTRHVVDGVMRRKCPQCDWIQYRNPTVGVAVVIVESARLLLGRRRDGDWCIPCGHVEWDETVEDAAIRELFEETGLVVTLQKIVAVKSNFHQIEKQTVGVWYEGRRKSGSVRPGGDLTEARFFDLATLPALKFKTDREVAAGLRPNG